MITQFVLGPFSQWLPSFVYLLFWIAALRLYFFKKNIDPKQKQARLLWLAASVFIFNLIWALVLTAANYQVWKADPFERLLLQIPLTPETPLFGGYAVFSFLKHAKLGYFIYYVLNKYWLDYFYGALLAIAFFAVLKVVQTQKDQLLDNNEATLALLLTLLAGWPAGAIFLPLAFIFLILYSIYNLAFLKQQRTPLAGPFMAAALVVIITMPVLYKIFPQLIFLKP